MPLFADIPFALLAISFALCLLVSALGFRRVDWFISLGYGFSIAAQAVLFLITYRATNSVWVIVQALLLLAYGLRLGIYLTMRERSPSFARELAASKERSAGINGPVKVLIWISVSALYVAMASPVLFAMEAQAGGIALWSLPVGIVLMILGLATEALADWQKARFKAQFPSRFASHGLYRIVRYPNYFGEMLFWFGLLVSGIAAYQSILAWLIALAGCVCIQLIMIGSARRLEIKQGERYGDDADYQAFTRSVPALIPLIPLYSVRNAKIYLG